MFTNKELAQFCIMNNTIEKINNLNWNVNEMCISYFIGSKPLWWDNNYWRCCRCGTYNDSDVCDYCSNPPNKYQVWK